jgi:hypothetical protein
MAKKPKLKLVDEIPSKRTFGFTMPEWDLIAEYLEMDTDRVLVVGEYPTAKRAVNVANNLRVGQKKRFGKSVVKISSRHNTVYAEKI